MPTKTSNGVDVPVGSDPYNLTADLLRMAKSLNVAIPVENAQARDNLAEKYDGMMVVRLDEGGIQQVYSGGLWYGFRSASAAASVPGIAVGGSYALDVVYPAGVFPGPPRAVLTPPSGRLTVAVANMTASGCRFVLDNRSDAASSSGVAAWVATYGLQ